MLRIRLFEDAVLRLFLANEVEGTTHLCQGREADPVGVCSALEPGDTVPPRTGAQCRARTAEGVAAEVVDLRTLRALDVTTIAESVSRTGRLVVVEEVPPTGGYAADVIASAVERVGPLAARWVTMSDLPIPFARTLEDAALPSADAVAAAARLLS
jgi:pyruvate/2-oxoglutarate/acetoin dehydrogenase E1 component